jgi:outer membrane protein TolC
MKGLHLEFKNCILLVFLIVFFSNAIAQKNLDFYIQSALYNSPLLKEYLSQLETAHIDSLRLKAGLGIKANAVSNSLYAPVIKGWGYDDAITDGINLNATISVSKELTGKRNRQNQFEAIGIQKQSAQLSGKISEQELKKNISTLYITAFGSWQQFNFNNEMLELLSKEKEILKKLTETGQCKQTEYLSFLVILQQQVLQVERVKNEYQNNFAQLNFACGIKDTAFTALADPGLKVERNPDLFTSVFYQQFMVDSLKLVNSDKQIDFSYQPKINLVADGGYLSTLAVTPYKNFGVSAGVSVNIPLYDGGQRKLLHDQVAIAQLNRMNYRDFFTSQFQQQIDQLQQQLQAKQKLEEKINRQIEYAKLLIDANRKLVETGEVSITEYLLSLGNFLNAKNMLIENSLEKYQIVNELNYWNRTK